MNQILDKAYNHEKQEDKIYQRWEESGFFNPDKLSCLPGAPTYTIVLPPPNITDKLHMGHASLVAIEDLLIRYRRLSGDRTLWLPGTDHASIATQNVVEKKIKRESGQTRYDLGREKFLQEVDKFISGTQSEIINQIRKLGASLDWSRLAFTLDKPRQKAVWRMFKEMYEAGAIYRGERIVNWCPRCHSTLADDELEYKEEKAKLYWLKYGPFILATTRPETKLGDTGVAVHPDDDRYRGFIGKELEIDGVLGKFKVKVVADQAVDRNFGSGVIKVTPAHDFTDNEIAARHNLPVKKIIDENGRMMANCGKYAGLTTKEAREAIVKDMGKLGLIDHIDEDYQHRAALCYRCGTVIEPLTSKQWFVSVDKKLERLGGLSLKERALMAARQGEISFIPERFTKRYLDWMENLHDWCISRQIWFGHRVPVWYRGDEEEVYVGEKPPQGNGWHQDEDTLDTWFSSSLWTFSTLGWPDNFKDGVKTGDLKKFHPTQVLETGYEIITLWVSRMIMMSFFALNEPPFNKVYLHGLILDKDGKKMAKSKGNGVDPLEMIKQFGADASRLSIIMGATPGNDSRFNIDKVESKRNLVNKIWNISRFILSLAGEKKKKNNNVFEEEKETPVASTLADRWILEELNTLIISVTARLEAMEFSLAAEEMQDFTWGKLADWYLEIAKIEDDKEKILLFILRKILILWHPFIPYASEAIWSSFNKGLLMVAKWPQAFLENNLQTEDILRDFSLLRNIVVAIRNARSENKIEPAKKLKCLIFFNQENVYLLSQSNLISSLRTGLESVEFIKEKQQIKGAITIVLGDLEIYLLGGIDNDKEKARLAKEQKRLENLLSLQKKKLANQNFVNRAPTALVALEREKLNNYQIELKKIKETLTNLN